MRVVCLLSLLWSLVEVHSQTFPYVSFNGQTLANHSYVDLSLVGTSGSDSVRCHTDFSICCSGTDGSHRGDWYFPNGTRLLHPGNRGIYENRLSQRVDLRRNHGTSPTGIYRCDISTNAVHDDTDISVRDTVYVGLYTGSGGDAIPGDIIFDSDQLVLTCISSGGPATTVTWTRDSTTVTQGTQTVLNDPVTAQYTHTLTVTTAGEYTCTVSNDKPSSASSTIFVAVASPPTGVTALRGPTSITVTWTPPSPLGDTTGYRISYTTGSDVDIDVGSTNSYTLTGLSNGQTYTISIVATSSSGLPSAPLVVTVSLVPSAPYIDSTPTVTATTVTITGSVPSDSVVTGFSVQWQRDTSRGCSNEDEGSITTTGSFTSYTITGLEEGNRYTISVKLFNDAGRGPVSNSVTAMTTEAAPSGSPASITVGTLTANSVTLQWGEVACLERNGEITGYTVTAANSDGVVKGTSRVNVDARQATISELTPSTQYTVSVSAVNGAGTGPVTTLPVETPGPPPPTGVTAVQDGPTSITVTWTPPSPLGDTTGYRISYTTGSDVNIDGGSTNSYTLTGLTNGQTYTISIVAMAPNRPTSTPIEAQVSLVGVPEKPTVDMDNIETTPTTITTSWSFPPDATGSEVSWELTGQTRRRRVMNAEGGTSGRLRKDQNSYTIGSLRSGTSYDITVTVFNPAGNSSTTFTHSSAEDSCIRSDSSPLSASLGGVLGVVIVTGTVVQAMVIVFFTRKLQRAKASTNTGVEIPTLSGKNYLGSEQFQTSSNEAYNVVRGTGRTAEGEYEVPRDLPPSTSSQPTTAAAGDSLYESV